MAYYSSLTSASLASFQKWRQSLNENEAREKYRNHRVVSRVVLTPHRPTDTKDETTAVKVLSIDTIDIDQIEKNPSSAGIDITAVAGTGFVGGSAATASVTAGISAAGYTSSGVAAGSWAASIMSAEAVASGGGVAAGGFTATMQSIGVVGLGAGLASGIFALGAAGAGYGGYKLVQYLQKPSLGDSSIDWGMTHGDVVALYCPTQQRLLQVEKGAVQISLRSDGGKVGVSLPHGDTGVLLVVEVPPKGFAFYHIRERRYLGVFAMGVSTGQPRSGPQEPPSPQEVFYTHPDRAAGSSGTSLRLSQATTGDYLSVDKNGALGTVKNDERATSFQVVTVQKTIIVASDQESKTLALSE